MLVASRLAGLSRWTHTMRASNDAQTSDHVGLRGPA